MKKVKNIFLAILLLIMITFALSIVFIAAKTYNTRIEYIDIIQKYSEQYNSDPYMIASIIKVESNFDEHAESHMNAKGLMQIVPDTGEWIAEKLGEDYHDERLFDPDYNIHLGAYYYEYLYEHFGDVDIALAAYNGGMGNVEKWLADPEVSYTGEKLDNIPFSETRNYVDKVNNAYGTYRLFYPDGLPTQEEFSNPLGLVWENYITFLKTIAHEF